MKKALKPSFQMADDPALARGNAVITALTGNTHFPTPKPTLVELQAAVDAYKESLAKADFGGREEIAQKNADKKSLIGLLRDECDYINGEAKGNIVMLSTCGLPLSKDPAPRVLGTPVLKVENNGSARLQMSSPAVYGAVAYRHQYKADADAEWSEISSSRANCIIESLQPGTVYSCRMIAIGTNGQITMSDVVTKMAA